MERISALGMTLTTGEGTKNKNTLTVTDNRTGMRPLL